MNLKELKTEHPAIYEAAVSEGVAQERDRVAAHLTYGRLNALSMKTALAAIENGDGMTMALQAKYLTADRNERDLQARAGDEHLAASALDGATSKPAASGADAVADALDRQLNGAVL